MNLLQQQQRKESQEHIRRTLVELGSATFTELWKKSNIRSKTTFSKRLQELEERGEVVREHVQQKGKRPKYLIKPSWKALDPINGTLTELERVVGPYARLDIGLGKKFLTRKVAQTCIGILESQYAPLGIIPGESWFEKLGEEPKEDVSLLNEVKFLQALACYDAEEYGIPLTAKEYGIMQTAEKEKRHLKGEREHATPEHGLYWITKLDYEKPVLEFLINNVKDAKLFPARAIVRKRGLQAHFEALLKWAETIRKGSKICGDLYGQEYFSHKHRVVEGAKIKMGGNNIPYKRTKRRNTSRAS